jgi:hypothetical protein
MLHPVKKCAPNSHRRNSALQLVRLLVLHPPHPHLQATVSITTSTIGAQSEKCSHGCIAKQVLCHLFPSACVLDLPRREPNSVCKAATSVTMSERGAAAAQHTHERWSSCACNVFEPCHLMTLPTCLPSPAHVAPVTNVQCREGEGERVAVCLLSAIIKAQLADATQKQER